MFEKKKLWMVLATAALVAACGGGSGGGSSGGGGGGGGGGNGDGNGNGDPSGDTTLQSYLDMHPDQIIVNMLLPLSAYENTDAANGGLFGQAKGSDGNGAPFQTFGLRISDTALAAGDAAITEESATGRLAISLTEREETVDSGETAETVEIMLTGVTLSTDADGLLSVSQTDDATLYVSGTNAEGESIENISVALPAGAVSIVPITTIVGGAGDTSGDVGLVFDLNAAFAAADTEDAEELAKLAALSGRFDMNFALSVADIQRDGTLLDDQSIRVTGNSVEAVTGSGVAGNIWITAEPPAAP